MHVFGMSANQIYFIHYVIVYVKILHYIVSGAFCVCQSWWYWTMHMYAYIYIYIYIFILTLLHCCTCSIEHVYQVALLICISKTTCLTYNCLFLTYYCMSAAEENVMIVDIFIQEYVPLKTVSIYYRVMLYCN